MSLFILDLFTEYRINFPSLQVITDLHPFKITAVLKEVIYDLSWKKSDLWSIFEVTTVTPLLQSHNHNSGTWQLTDIYDSCSVLWSRDLFRRNSSQCLLLCSAVSYKMLDYSYFINLYYSLSIYLGAVFSAWSPTNSPFTYVWDLASSKLVFKETVCHQVIVDSQWWQMDCFDDPKRYTTFQVCCGNLELTSQ